MATKSGKPGRVKCLVNVPIGRGLIIDRKNYARGEEVYPLDPGYTLMELEAGSLIRAESKDPDEQKAAKALLEAVKAEEKEAKVAAKNAVAIGADLVKAKAQLAANELENINLKNAAQEAENAKLAADAKELAEAAKK